MVMPGNTMPQSIDTNGKCDYNHGPLKPGIV